MEMMILSWLVLVAVVSLALSLASVLWNALAGAAHQNERVRLWVRRTLLLEATEQFADGIVTLAEAIANTPSGIRGWWRQNSSRYTRNADLLAVALLAIYEIHHHYFVDRAIHSSDVSVILAIAIGIIVYLLAVDSEPRLR